MRTQVHTVPAKNGSTAFLEAHSGILAGADSQLPLEFFASPPDPAGHSWLGFTPDHAEEEAAAVFQRRHGRPPEYVFESRGLLLCGPIPEVTP